LIDTESHLWNVSRRGGSTHPLHHTYLDKLMEDEQFKRIFNKEYQKLLEDIKTKRGGYEWNILHSD